MKLSKVAFRQSGLTLSPLLSTLGSIHQERDICVIVHCCVPLLLGFFKACHFLSLATLPLGTLDRALLADAYYHFLREPKINLFEVGAVLLTINVYGHLHFNRAFYRILLLLERLLQGGRKERFFLRRRAFWCTRVGLFYRKMLTLFALVRAGFRKFDRHLF